MPSFVLRRRLSGAFYVEDAVLLAFELMVVDEKLNEFFDELLAQVIDVLNMSIAVIHLLGGDDAIVAVPAPDTLVRRHGINYRVTSVSLKNARQTFPRYIINLVALDEFPGDSSD
jgi:hypothetical protein